MLTKTYRPSVVTDRDFPRQLDPTEMSNLGGLLGVYSVVFDGQTKKMRDRSIATLNKWIAVWAYRAMDSLSPEYSYSDGWIYFDGDQISAQEMYSIIEDRRNHPYNAAKRPPEYQK
jgi:hypothetical protein